MKTGTITNLQPAGGYDGQNGHINTFHMTIQFPDGMVTGEIGSKSQTYPANVGDEINVEVSNTQYGVRFKKVNPQYANAPQGQQQGQQKQSNSNNEKDNKSFAMAYAKDLVMAGTIRLNEMLGWATAMDDWMGGKTPQAQPQPTQPPQRNYPETVNPPDDDLPF